MEEYQSLSATQIRRRAQMQQELLSIIDKEEKYWQHRSREKWVLQGDSNTSFFHRISNGCKRKRTIFSMSDGDSVIHGTDDLLNHAIVFYKDLFGPATDSGIRLENQIWGADEKISVEEREIMDRTFSEAEIKNAIDQMESNKAAGPDGIPAEFYKECWDIIKTDMVTAFNDFHIHAIDLKRINYGIITLIPKGPDADIIQRYRQICLLQVLFKIFTKVLTIRAIPIMNKVIHPCQTAIIKGIFITDGVAFLQEVLREAKFRKQQGVVLKIDFEKAYDKSKLGFSV
jgi:hypothetical protein